MESVKINDRLLSAVPFVREGMRLADIGTDHAYLPIHLVMSGKIESAVAADINQGPLDKALENIHKNGLEEKISTVLCDGLKKVESSLVDDIAIFGMGGELIVKIIDEAPWLKSEEKRLILQPMTHPEKVREYLAIQGFDIIGEALSYDRGKIYQTICAQYDGKTRETDLLSLHFGEYILREKSELLLALLNKTKMQLERKINGKLSGGEDVSAEKELLDCINNYEKR